MAFNLGGLGDIASLEQKGVQAKQAFEALKAAIKNADYKSGDFASILGPLDQLISIVQSLKSNPQASAAANATLPQMQSLRNDVAAGKITSQQMQGKVNDIVSQLKDKLGPYGKML